MTLCPVALAVGCKRCPVFSICPAKSMIGDQPKGGKPSETDPAEKQKPGPKSH